MLAAARVSATPLLSLDANVSSARKQHHQSQVLRPVPNGADYSKRRREEIENATDQYLATTRRGHIQPNRRRTRISRQYRAGIDYAYRRSRFSATYEHTLNYNDSLHLRIIAIGSPTE
jgi:hypothetical protein